MRRVERMPRRPWTDDEIETVRINFADWPTWLVSYLVNRTDSAVHNLAHKLGLSKSEKFKRGPYAGRWNPENPKAKAHRFPKGHVPANKGLRRPGWSAGRMRQTQFKKGQRPHTWVPIGTRRRDRDAPARSGRLLEREGSRRRRAGHVPIQLGLHAHRAVGGAPRPRPARPLHQVQERQQRRHPNRQPGVHQSAPEHA